MVGYYLVVWVNYLSRNWYSLILKPWGGFKDFIKIYSNFVLSFKTIFGVLCAFESCYVAQAGLIILLPQSAECWDYRPSCQFALHLEVRMN